MVKIVNDFHPKNQKSIALRTHCQASGWSLTQQDRTIILLEHVLKHKRVMGGTQSLHADALDEATQLCQTGFSTKIIRDTQICLQRMSICNTVDHGEVHVY